MSAVDSRKKSLSEALLNSFGGYPLGYVLGLVILPLSVGWIDKDPFTANLFIAAVFSTVSFLKSYYLRRFFAKHGIEDNFVILFIKAAKRIKKSRFFICDLIKVEKLSALRLDSYKI